jgi:hypothetical protein
MALKMDDARIRLVEPPLRLDAYPATSRVSPALRSWIKNYLVPAMVDEYVAEQAVEAKVASECEAVRESESDGK